MSKKDLHKEAYEQAEKELLEEKIEEAKSLIKTTLESIELKKEEKKRVEEQLRVLKLDLEDLRKGNFEKIKERKEKSTVARNVGIHPDEFESMVKVRVNGVAGVFSGATCTQNAVLWTNATSGTYTVMNGTGENVNYYL